MSTYIFANLKQHLIKVTPCIKDLVHTQPTDFGDIGGLPDKVLQFRQNILLRELLKNIAMEDASEPWVDPTLRIYKISSFSLPSDL